MAERLFVSIYDIEHVRMHVWELERLIEDMRETNNPMTDRLQRALARFVKADMQKDRA